MSLELGLGWEGPLPSETEAGTSGSCARAGLFQLHLVERGGNLCGLLNPALMAWGSPFPGWGLATRVTSSGLPWWASFALTWLPQASGFP